jgi:uncharacterized protein with HEPN domain
MICFGPFLKSKLPAAFQEQHAHIVWHGVVSFRNQLIHGYFGVDYQILWYIVQNDLQDLESQLLDL